MISFKVALSLFIAALVCQCFALPIDQSTELLTTLSATTESLSVRHVDEPMITPLTSRVEESHLEVATKPVDKRASVPHSFTDQSTTFETGTKETRSFTDSFTPETESSSSITHIFATRNHVEEHLETETPVSITTVTVPFEKRAFPGDSTSVPETESVSNSSSIAETVQSGKDTRHILDDIERSSKGFVNDKTRPYEAYKQPHGITEESREDRFLDKTNFPKAEYDPSSSTVEVKFPTNQMYPDENRISVTEETFTTMKSPEISEKREEKPEKVKSSSEVELSTVRPVDGTEKRLLTLNDKASIEDELTTVKPAGTVEKREEKPEKVKSSSEVELSTVRPVDGAKKRGFLSSEKALAHEDELKLGQEESSSTMKPSDQLIKRSTVPAKEASLVGDKQESTAALDQGKDTPVSEKKESNH